MQLSYLRVSSEYRVLVWPQDTQCTQPCSLLSLHCGRGRWYIQKHISYSLAWLPQQITCLIQVHCSCTNSYSRGIFKGLKETNILQKCIFRRVGWATAVGSQRQVSCQQCQKALWYWGNSKGKSLPGAAVVMHGQHPDMCLWTGLLSSEVGHRG